jgi:hypothetical protein
MPSGRLQARQRTPDQLQTQMYVCFDGTDGFHNLVLGQAGITPERGCKQSTIGFDRRVGYAGVVA